MASRFDGYLQDPFLARLQTAVRAAGPLRSIAVDLTNVCNLRCQGCYFFGEGLDRHGAASGEAELESFVAREVARGTNFVTVVGGEPALVPDRLARLARSFRLSVATNGLRRIPGDGLENVPIGISVWGDADTDRELRGGGRGEIFEAALKNYQHDPRAFFYYTVAPGRAHEIQRVVERCVDNGNRVLFNLYSDLGRLGGDFDHRQGFGLVREGIERMIDAYPGSILMTSFLAGVVTTGRLGSRQWGRDVCASISSDHPINAGRIQNGHAYDHHFRAYNADLLTTRRCCTGSERSCDSCFDTWEHFSWIQLDLRNHLGSAQAFTEWLTTTYLFYFINRLVDVDEGARLLPEIHRRTRRAPALAPA